MWYLKWIVPCVQVPGRPNLSFAGEAMTIVPWYFGFIVLLIAVSLIDIQWLNNLMILVQLALYWLFLKWFIANLASNGQPLGLSFSGSVWAYLGWTILAAISVITIIGWAWVYVAWMRWVCRNIQGTRREVLFIGTRTGVSLARDRGRDRLRLHHPDSVGVSLDMTAGWRRRPFWPEARTRTRKHHLRWRTEPSCATEATSVPSGLKIRPRVRPRPPCALGESCA